MSDLISREEVLRAIITAGEVEPDLGYTHLHKVIENLPSAEPKKGKWKRHPGYREFDVCTACGFGCKRREYGLMPDTDGTPTEWMTEYSYQYCPNCGAKMEVV